MKGFLYLSGTPDGTTTELEIHDIYHVVRDVLHGFDHHQDSMIMHAATFLTKTPVLKTI